MTKTVFYFILKLTNKIFKETEVKNMAKRRTGVGKPQKSHSRKTPKRLAIKKRMLEIKAMKPVARKKALLGE